VNRLYEVSKYVSLTAHMWSGFNLIGNLAFWRSLPEHVREIVNRAVATHVERQRAYTVGLNLELETKLATERGMVSTRRRRELRAVLSGDFYRRWRGSSATPRGGCSKMPRETRLTQNPRGAAVAHQEETSS